MKKDGCVQKTLTKDGFIHCPGGRVLFSDFDEILLYKLTNISECESVGFPHCDVTTCYNVYSNSSNCFGNECMERHVICTSHCGDEERCQQGAFQCADGRLILFSQFCDGVLDCSDRSDELRSSRQHGFKCSECVLPQTNLHDNFPHCNDSSDLCSNDSSACFQCLDQRLIISSNQVCDGVSDCYDMSDECLCEQYFDTEVCFNVFKSLNCFQNADINQKSVSQQRNLSINIPSVNVIPTTTCSSKFGSIQAAVCDGRPECRNYEDECECENSPAFCNDTCRFFFPMGDRYCDGVEDPAWKLINKSACPQGFDEADCPKRFKCMAKGKVSIDGLRICDGAVDCDDESDETNCPDFSRRDDTLFASDSEMISNPAIRFAFWIMGFFVIFGNSYVIISTIAYIKSIEKANQTTNFQHIIILNIAIADFIMGIYLLTIAAYSVAYSKIYGDVDGEWRSSLNCSIVGSLVIISSETSCFLMVVLTVFRLIHITNPIASLTFSLLPWKMCLSAVWLFSFLLSFVPILDITAHYFVHTVSFTSKFNRNGSWYMDVNKLKQFACRYAVLSNTTITNHGNDLRSIKLFLKSHLPNSGLVRNFGYYGETSVCMPRFYVGLGDDSWEYTIAIIMLNFASFVFIVVSYFIIYKHSSKSSAKLGNTTSDQQAAKLQRRIARIIATDFCCWIPICIMTYVRLIHEFSDIVYQISAVLLLPINSAVNPFLFSSLPDKIFLACRQKYQTVFSKFRAN